jgi:hypothetical protein
LLIAADEFDDSPSEFTAICSYPPGAARHTKQSPDWFSE